jgi:hypothetical protein
MDLEQFNKFIGTVGFGAAVLIFCCIILWRALQKKDGEYIELIKDYNTALTNLTVVVEAIKDALKKQS